MLILQPTLVTVRKEAEREEGGEGRKWREGGRKEGRKEGSREGLAAWLSQHREKGGSDCVKERDEAYGS